MKKKKADDFEMRPEYTLAGGVQNPYAARFHRGTNLVLIDPEVFVAFPGAEEVNSALRLLLKAGAQAVKGKAQRQSKAS